MELSIMFHVQFVLLNECHKHISYITNT